MMQLRVNGRSSRLYVFGRVALLSFVLGCGYPPHPAGAQLGQEAKSGASESEVRCRGQEDSSTGVRFESLVHEVSTSAQVGNNLTEVRWLLSSEVSAVGDPTSKGVRYCYAYVFSNVGSAPVKISLVSPHVALSPLFGMLQDFSLVLQPGGNKAIEFSTVSAPELSLAAAYNSTHDQKMGTWAFVSSGPISLYLPAALGLSYEPPS